MILRLKKKAIQKKFLNKSGLSLNDKTKSVKILWICVWKAFFQKKNSTTE